MVLVSAPPGLCFCSDVVGLCLCGDLRFLPAGVVLLLLLWFLPAVVEGVEDLEAPAKQLDSNNQIQL